MESRLEGIRYEKWPVFLTRGRILKLSLAIWTVTFIAYKSADMISAGKWNSVAWLWHIREISTEVTWVYLLTSTLVLARFQ